MKHHHEYLAKKGKYTFWYSQKIEEFIDSHYRPISSNS